MQDNQSLEQTKRLPKLLNWQKTVVEHDARFKILRCGRRTGKTFGIIIDSLSLGYKYPGLSMAYIGLTYGHAKDVVWEDYLKLAEGTIAYKNSQELLIRLHNGSRIKLYSWDSIDNMLGKKYHKVYGDEVAVAKNFRQAWDNVIEPTLLDYHGEAWLTSMPRGKGQFKKLIDDSKTKDDWQDFHFTSYDNESIPNVKEDLDRKRKDIAPSVFAQQYLAEFTDLEGRIYTEFNRDDTLSDIPFTPEKWAISVDFGYNHPLAVYLCAISKDSDIHVYRELYKTKLDDEQRLAEINKLIEGYEIAYGIADSEDPIAVVNLNKNLPFEVKPAVKGKGSVLSGINTVKSYLHSGRLTINDQCVNLCDEMESYSWKLDPDGKEKDEPIKENDDACDSIRYLVNYIESPNSQPIEYATPIL
jgi:PBSX family phage terminase large subunit